MLNSTRGSAAVGIPMGASIGTSGPQQRAKMSHSSHPSLVRIGNPNVQHWRSHCEQGQPYKIQAFPLASSLLIATINQPHRNSERSVNRSQTLTLCPPASKFPRP
jgi:hypothetical protein